MKTPHIEAEIGDFGKTVLMPGDPLRSEYIAKNFLSDIKLVNDIRAVHGYTGYYKGIKVSTMASGMGIPAIGIYSYELYNFFGVENILRVGSCGAIGDKVKVRDLILAMGASTDSDYLSQFNLPGNYSPVCDYNLLAFAKESADEKKVNCHVGSVVSSDVFYNKRKDANQAWKDMGILGVEMEAAGLYANAAAAKKRALAILTVSDNVFTGESLSANERQTSFADMIEVALECALKAEKI